VQSSSQIVTTNKPTPSFLRAGYPSCRPANSVRALNGRQVNLFVCYIHPIQVPGIKNRSDPFPGWMLTSDQTRLCLSPLVVVFCVHFVFFFHRGHFDRVWLLCIHFCVLCLGCSVLDVSSTIDWKDSSTKGPIVC